MFFGAEVEDGVVLIVEEIAQEHIMFVFLGMLKSLILIEETPFDGLFFEWNRYDSLFLNVLRLRVVVHYTKFNRRGFGVLGFKRSFF